MKKILLSIKPKYVNRILAGTKKVEYRKNIPLQKGVSHVLIYSSSPIKRVIGEFRIAEVLSDTPNNLWKKTFRIGGIDKTDYFTYFAKHSIAYAYKIEDLRIFDTPRTLSDFGVNRAPQNFMYVEDDNMKFLNLNL